MARDLYRGLATAGAAVFFAGALVVSTAPAHAQSGSGNIWVQPHPNQVAAGEQVIVIGSCGDVNVDASFESLAFAGSREVQANVDRNSGQASAEVDIPQGLRPNTYNITLFCAGTEQASSTLTVMEDHRKQPTKGPRTGGGGAAAGTTGGTRTSLIVAAGLVAAAGGLGLLVARRRRVS